MRNLRWVFNFIRPCCRFSSLFLFVIVSFEKFSPRSGEEAVETGQL